MSRQLPRCVRGFTVWLGAYHLLGLLSHFGSCTYLVPYAVEKSVLAPTQIVKHSLVKSRPKRASSMAYVLRGGGGLHGGDGIKLGGREMGGLERDAMHMRRALELAARGFGHTRPNPAVGCIIVDKDGAVVGEGFHPRAGQPHAEVWAIRQAGERARGGTAYVTLEPCNHFGRTPPCTSALLDSGVVRVVAGMVDPDSRTAGTGLRRLADAGVDIMVGVEGAACQALNAPFVHRILNKSCYGVLHCSLDTRNTGNLENTPGEDGLVVPPDQNTYAEYDAVVVEGRAGMDKLEASLPHVPSTVWRIIVVTARNGLEEELRSTLSNAIWTDLPNQTLVVVTAEDKRRGAITSGSVREYLTARGITVIDKMPPDHSAHPGSTSYSGVVTAVSGELYRRGLLSACWEVSPPMAKCAMEQGCIHRAVVRTKRRDGIHNGSSATSGSFERDAIVLDTIGRMSGKDEVRVRKHGFTRRRADGFDFTEVLLPISVAPIAQHPPPQCSTGHQCGRA